MRIRTLVAAAAAGLSLCACQGLKDALSAHSNSVARTVGSQELTVTQLSDLLGNAKIPVQITKTNVATLAGIWADYHRLAYAAAHNDTLRDHVDAAVIPLVNNQRVAMFMDSLVAHVHIDSASEAVYNQAGGDLLAARHILLPFPPAATPGQKDSVKKMAGTVRAQVTSANFTAMVKKYSKDPGAATDTGYLGVFAKGQMVPAFSNATAALKPGEISQPIESEYGYHIIQRLAWNDAKPQYIQAYTQAAQQHVFMTIFDERSKGADLQVKKDAVANIRDALGNIHAHGDDHTVLATYSKGGKFTIADFITWIDVRPQDQRQQIVQELPQVQAVPDSVVVGFLKQIALQPVLLRAADSAKVDLLTAKRDTLRNEFSQLVVEFWKQLNVAPDQLADSAKTTSDRQRLAASRVDAFINRFMAGEDQPTLTPIPIEEVLDAKYGVTMNVASMDRTVTQAEKVRAAADSARGSGMPSSAIPMPGGPGQPPASAAPGGAGQSPAPAPKAAPGKKPPTGDR